MDSMTKDELDCIKPLDESRIKRISKAILEIAYQIIWGFKQLKGKGAWTKNKTGRRKIKARGIEKREINVIWWNSQTY